MTNDHTRGGALWAYKQLEIERKEAADTIEALRAENARLQQIMAEETKDSLAFIRKQTDKIARLREALKPFADRAKYAEKYESERIMWPVAIGDLRAARAAMGETE